MSGFECTGEASVRCGGVVILGYWEKSHPGLSTSSVLGGSSIFVSGDGRFLLLETAPAVHVLDVAARRWRGLLRHDDAPAGGAHQTCRARGTRWPPGWRSRGDVRVWSCEAVAVTHSWGLPPSGGAAGDPGRRILHVGVSRPAASRGFDLGVLDSGQVFHLVRVRPGVPLAEEAITLALSRSEEVSDFSADFRGGALAVVAADRVDGCDRRLHVWRFADDRGAPLVEPRRCTLPFRVPSASMPSIARVVGRSFVQLKTFGLVPCPRAPGGLAVEIGELRLLELRRGLAGGFRGGPWRVQDSDASLLRRDHDLVCGRLVAFWAADPEGEGPLRTLRILDLAPGAEHLEG
ncbi:unnamed protein product [Prorocentrum cordatum]|uniref:Uncharacterized protein n=1 Tax=Prorocentrum cordatum TaxID=2364126 RepID=A0ABN9UX95_9DINO|nr:unnamed protein product [Polarella glacialis]